MSLTPWGQLFSVGGFLEYVHSNSYIFSDSTSNDVALYMDYIDQNILLGTHQGIPSCMRITSNEIQMNYHAFVNETFSIGTSNVRNYDTPHRFVIEGESNSIFGPHWAAYLKDDHDYPLFQHVNRNHDDIAMSFDVFWTGSNWTASDSNVFQLKKHDGKFQIMCACNLFAGAEADQDLYPALTINSNSYIGVGTSNPRQKLSIAGPCNSYDGPHLSFYVDEDIDYPLMQILNLDHDNIAQGYDAYWNGSNWISCSDTGNFKVEKSFGQYGIYSSSCNAPGEEPTWSPAIIVNSNSFLGFGTYDTTHRVTIFGENSSFLGPHTAVYTDADYEYPIYQQLNWSHDLIAQAYDAYYTSNGWISASATGNFKIEKYDSKFMIQSACNIQEGCNVDWKMALAISETGFVGIGTSNPNHLLTLDGPKETLEGPHLSFYVSNDSNYPLYQSLHWNHDDITQSYDCFFDGSNWISSDSNIFQLQKFNGRFLIRSACNLVPGSIANSQFRTAFMVNSNSFVGIGTQFTSFRLTMRAEDANIVGPHLAYYTNADNSFPVFQQLNWKHDDIHMGFDAMYTGIDWVSSYSNGNFKIGKQNGQFTISSACNTLPGIPIEWNHAFCISSSNGFVGIGTTSPESCLHVAQDCLVENDIMLGGDVLPIYDMIQDLGSSNYRFKDLWLSGGSIDMEHLQLKKDYDSGGLRVCNALTGATTTVLVKDIVLGDSSDASNNNLIFIQTSNNELRFKDSNGNYYSGIANLYTDGSNIGINTPANSNFALDLLGDINFTGTLFNNSVPFQTSRWTADPSNGIYVESNVGINGLADSNYALSINGDINFTGTLYNNSNPFQTSRWSYDPPNGIYINSNVGINAPADSNHSLTVHGHIQLDKGLKLRGLQISKSSGTMNNITQQVFAIPGVSNTSSNVFFYNGLYMKGMRLGAGDASGVLPVDIALPYNSNLIIPIPSSQYNHAIRFVTGPASNERMTLTGTGDLGINNTNPIYKLDVGGDINFTGFLLQNGQPFSSTQWSNVDSNVFIVSSNVGINTSNPAYPLDVDGDINFSGILLQNGQPFTSTQWSNVDSNVFILSSNVGINKIPSYPLDVVGSVNIDADINDIGLYIMNSNLISTEFVQTVMGVDYESSNCAYIKYTHFADQSNIMQMGIVGRSNITCTADGFVGINIESPEYMLHVDGDIYVSGDTICLSDERFKKNITPIEEALEKLDQISGYTYDPIKQTQESSKAKRLSQKRVGVLAQELEKVMPELVYEDSDGHKSVAYANLTALLLQGIKELKNELKDVKNKLNNLLVI